MGILLSELEDSAVRIAELLVMFNRCDWCGAHSRGPVRYRPFHEPQFSFEIHLKPRHHARSL